MDCTYHSKTCTGIVTSLLEMLVAITQGASAVFAKRQKFSQIAGISASKFPANAFIPSSHLAADLAQLQNLG